MVTAINHMAYTSTDSSFNSETPFLNSVYRCEPSISPLHMLLHGLCQELLYTHRYSWLHFGVHALINQQVHAVHADIILRLNLNLEVK